VEAEHVALLYLIQEARVRVSNRRPTVVTEVFVVPLSPSGLNHDRFLPHPLQFIIHYIILPFDVLELELLRESITTSLKIAGP
jgi:hypothetical protein